MQKRMEGEILETSSVACSSKETGYEDEAMSNHQSNPLHL